MTSKAMERSAQMFPVLTPAQIQRIAAMGQRQQVKAGELLFDAGDQNTCFFVVLSGAVAIVQPVGDEEQPVVAHGPGQFTGEINMLSARRSLVRARVTQDSEVLALGRDDLRTLVQRDSELSEILMRAFILRRVALVAEGHSDLVLVGSRHSASTLRLTEFLSRNGQPFTYQDVDSDPAVQTMLDRFHIGADEVPVVLCRKNSYVFKNPSPEMLAGPKIKPLIDKYFNVLCVAFMVLLIGGFAAIKFVG
jgi:thioredoxin reductase (NADPH)